MLLWRHLPADRVVQIIMATYESNIILMFYCRKMFIGGLSWQTTSGNYYYYYYYCYHRFTALLILSRTTQVSQYQKGKANLNLLEQEIVSGSVII